MSVPTPEFPAPDRTVQLDAGPVAYRDFGEGPPVLFVHGLLVDGRLWRKVAPLIAAAGHRCIVPDLPVGAHRLPMNEDADLDPRSMAGHIAELIERLDLGPVTVVGNDSGGAMSQMLAAERPELIDRLVLTPSDAFEVFPPKAFKPLLAIARVPGGLKALGQTMRLRAIRHSPAAFGWLIKHEKDADLIAEWVTAAREDDAVRRDTIKFMTEADPQHLLDADEKLASFDRPTLIAWAADDRFFKESLGRRLADQIPRARLEMIPDSYTFVPEDQPELLADAITTFLSEEAAPATLQG